MTRWSFGWGLFGVLAGAVAVVLGGCGLIRPSEELRYRLSVEVDTPSGAEVRAL